MAIGRFDSHIPEGEQHIPHPVVEIVVDEATIQVPVTSVSVEVDHPELIPDASRSDVYLTARALGALSRRTRDEKAQQLKEQLIARVKLQRRLRQISRYIETEIDEE